MDSGLVRYVNRGIRFALAKASSTYVGIKSTANPTTSFDLILPTALPGSTQALTVSATGAMGYQSLSGGGTVSSVALALPGDLSQSGGPITTTGTISISRSSQAANLFLASPDGAAGVPSYRAMLAADVPSLTASKISNFDAQVRTNRLDQLATAAAAVNFGGQLATNLATPASANDAANKAYVDAVASSTSNKGSVRVASTANISLSAPGTSIDGVTLSNGDLFLAKNQSTASANGIYVFNGSAAAATRATSADTSAEVKSGMFVFVQSGTVNGSNGFTLVTPDPITLDTTGLTFVQTSGAGQIINGTGLAKSGNTLSIDSAYPGQTSITTLGTVTTGTWNGTTLAVANGGTGATSAAAARTNLGATTAFRQAFTNASLTAGVLTVTHNIGQQFVQINVYDENNKLISTVDDVTCTSTVACTIDLTSFGTLSGTWNVVVTG